MWAKNKIRKGKKLNKKFLFGCVFGLIGIIIIIAIIGVAYFVDSRNKMIAKEIYVEESWSQIQNVYQRRLDLIPNLANSTQAYMQLEKDIFEAIASARSGIQAAGSPGEIESANAEVNSFIRDLKVVVEDTPELRASETVRDLMTQLEGTENRITVERQRFNESVGDYNTYIRMWPRSMIASMFDFEAKIFFEAQPGAEVAPEINLELD